MRLSAPCPICNSTRWCGRPCKSAPSQEVVTDDPLRIPSTAKQRNAKPAAVNKATVINTNAAQQAKWRADNADTNRQRAREGMRKLRAAKKDTNV